MGPVRGERPPWDKYFIELAHMVGTRSTCNRRAVGAVLVRDRRILATGYNGSPPGFDHCSDVGCLLVDGHCVRTTHAEVNAIIQAALHGVSTEGATLYCTSFPCLGCTKMLIGSGVVRIVYRDAYEDELSAQFLERAGIPVERVEGGGAAPPAPSPAGVSSSADGTRGESRTP